MHRFLPLLALAAGCASRPTPPPETGPPDVLVLTLCTLRADHLGVYGYDRPTSPNLDALAASGVVFERVVTNGPWTRPGVATSITGQVPRTLGIDGRHSLNPAFTTLAEHFDAAGYYTVGVTANPNTRAKLHFDQGYDSFHDPNRIWADGYRKEKQDADEVTGIALKALADKPADAPWFAHLILVDAHAPYGDDHPDFRIGGNGRIDRYDRQIRDLDRSLGDFFEALDKMGDPPEVIVINADHGEGFQEHRRDDLGHGKNVFDSTLYVPLIVHAPTLGIAPRRVQERVELVDTTPTLVDLLDIPHTADMEGQSLVPALRGGDVPDRPYTISETTYRGIDRGVVITDTHKLVVTRVGEKKRKHLRLFDHRQDPYERTEGTGKENSDLKQELLAIYEQWREAHPKLRGEPELEAAPDEADAELLKVLGYVDDTDAGD